MEGSSVFIGEQNIVQDGLTFIQDLLTTVDFTNDEDQASKSEEVKWDNDGIGGSTDYSEVKNDSSTQLHLSNLTQNTLKKFKKEVHNCC